MDLAREYLLVGAWLAGSEIQVCRQMGLFPSENKPNCQSRVPSGGDRVSDLTATHYIHVNYNLATSLTATWKCLVCKTT